MPSKTRCLWALSVVLVAVAMHWNLTSAPRISVDRTHILVPPIPKGEQQEVAFIISNAGNRSLEIANVQTTCGCTQATVDSSTIAPRGDTVLRLGVSNSTQREAAIVVESNDPAQPALEIKLTFERSEPFACDPQRCDFGLVSKATLPIKMRLLVSVFDRKITASEVLTSTDLTPLELTLETAVRDEGHLLVDATLLQGAVGFSGGFIDVVHPSTKSNLSIPVVASFRD